MVMVRVAVLCCIQNFNLGLIS